MPARALIWGSRQLPCLRVRRSWPRSRSESTGTTPRALVPAWIPPGGEAVRAGTGCDGLSGPRRPQPAPKAGSPGSSAGPQLAAGDVAGDLSRDVTCKSRFRQDMLPVAKNENRGECCVSFRIRSHCEGRRARVPDPRWPLRAAPGSGPFQAARHRPPPQGGDREGRAYRASRRQGLADRAHASRDRGSQLLDRAGGSPRGRDRVVRRRSQAHRHAELDARVLEDADRGRRRHDRCERRSARCQAPSGKDGPDAQRARHVRARGGARGRPAVHRTASSSRNWRRAAMRSGTSIGRCGCRRSICARRRSR